jgi:hypothetical protein
VVSNQESTGNPILDKVLNDILAETRLFKPRYWINTLAYQKMVKEIGNDLVEQGVLSRHKKRLRLAVSSSQQAPLPLLKYGIKSHLREIILAGGQPELADQVLLSLLQQANLLRLVFTVGERKTASKVIKNLLMNGGLGETLKKIVAASGEH